jgi:methyl-accepting chemotaxis protein
MRFDRYAGIVSAVGLVLIWAVVAWLGVAGPIWRAYWTASPEQWLGFAGAIAGAMATLLAGALALFAAYKTLRPIKDQLDQLVKQNDHNLLDRLGIRAARLNGEEIVIQRVAAGCEVISRALEPFSGNTINGPREAVEGLREAVQRLEKSVEDMQKQKGEVWGDVATQEIRKRFTDLALRSGSQAIRLVSTAENDVRTSFIFVKKQIKEWEPLSSEVHDVGNQLFQLVQLESRAIGRTIAEVEVRLFGAHGPTRSH